MLTARLDGYSRTIFAARRQGAARRACSGRRAEGGSLRFGRQRQFHSLVEETLLTLTRAMPFLRAQLGDRAASRNPRRGSTASARTSTRSSAHETRLSDKIQFLLDASLGLIGVEQNDIFKVLTIVSVIGIPPTLIASMYGMNFKNIPEYDWTYGYQYGLDADRRSARCSPLLWFKWRRWW